MAVHGLACIVTFFEVKQIRPPFKKIERENARQTQALPRESALTWTDLLNQLLVQS